MIKKFLIFIASFMTGVCVLSFEAAAYDTAAVGENNTFSMGSMHTAVIKEDNSLWVWGSNLYGQVGNGGKTDVYVNGKHYQRKPVKILDDIVSVSCGDLHMAAIDMDGSLWVWGENSSGQVGNGGKGDGVDKRGNTCQTTPVKVLDDVSAVCCGDLFTAAIKKDGSLWMWGGWLYGGSSYPKKILDGVRAFSGGDCCAVIMNDDSLWYWGYVEDKGYFDVSKRIKVADKVRTVSGNDNSLVFAKKDGTVWVWGSNSYGLFGNGKVDDEIHFHIKKLKAVQVSGLKDVVSVSIGGPFDFAAALQSDGTLWLWGCNLRGQIGNGNKGTEVEIFSNKILIQLKPQKILTGVKAVCCGVTNTVIAEKTDGTLWSWGESGVEELGYEGGDKIFKVLIGGADNPDISYLVYTPRKVEVISLKKADNSSEDKKWKSTVSIAKGKDSVTLSWDKAKDAKSYTLYNYKNGKYVKMKSTAGTSITLNGMKSGKTYKLLLKYKKSNGSYSSMENSCRLTVTPDFKGN